MSNVRPWPHVEISTNIRTGKPILKWAPVEGATKYEIHRSLSRTGPFAMYWTQEQTSYSNSIVTPGCPYYYKIVALGTGLRKESGIVSITADCSMPIATVAIREDTGLPVLTWAPVTGSRKYEIHRAISKKGPYTQICTVSDTFHPIPMTGEASVWYTVRALCDKSKNGDSHFSDPINPTETLKKLITSGTDNDEHPSEPITFSFSEENYSASVPGDYKDYVRSVFLRYMSRHPSYRSVTTFPDYFQRELNISDGYRYVKQLLRQGFLEMDGEDTVALTQAGQNAINENHIKFFEWSTPYVSYQEYSTEHALRGTRYPFEVVMNRLLLKKRKEFCETNNFTAIRDISLDIAQLYHALDNGEKALFYYLISLFYDISGLEYYQIIISYFDGKLTKKAVEEAFYGIAIRPSVIDGIRALNDYYQENMVHQIYLREPLDLQICPEDLMLELIADLQKGPYEYSQWKKRFFAAYQAILVDPAEETEP